MRKVFEEESNSFVYVFSVKKECTRWGRSAVQHTTRTSYRSADNTTIQFLFRCFYPSDKE